MRRLAVFLCLVVSCASILTTHQRLARTMAVPSTCDGRNADLSIVTYNTGFAPNINRLARERVLPVTAEIVREAIDDDIVAFQEVWIEEDKLVLIAALRETHPYLYAIDTRGKNEIPGDRCDAEAMTDIVACVESNCPMDALFACASVVCREELKELFLYDRPCFRCLVSSIGQGSLDGIKSRCIHGAGGTKVYGGSNGVLVFSKHPLESPMAVNLPASGANRVAILARLSLPGKQPIEFAFTHLSSNENVPPPERSIFSTWEDERGEQLDIIDQELRKRAKDGAIQMIVGDLNFGGSRPPFIEAYGEHNWREALEMGFWSPAALADRPLCSFCAGNTISHWTKSVLVDGVLLRSRSDYDIEAVCVEREFTRRVQIAGLRENLSDHVGIRTMFDLR